MEDYDVIVIGGGINGLTAAAYLGKAGLKTLVLEAKGECGTHSDTCEPGIPGFLHNTHATWIISAMSPAMDDLELSEYGLEYCSTEFAFGKLFLDGTIGRRLIADCSDMSQPGLRGLSLPHRAQGWESDDPRKIRAGDCPKSPPIRQDQSCSQCPIRGAQPDQPL